MEINGDEEDQYFDPTYTEVERILGTTDIFPIIHPKKSNELKGFFVSKQSPLFEIMAFIELNALID